jgi:alpha-beta hydrolase superfamily lysophospholipase
MSDLRIIRGASPSRHGGIHWYEWKPKDEARIGPIAPDLVLLHPMPHDGAFFNTIAPFLAAGRTVIAPDYPGYGRSDPFGGTPSIEIYADAMMDTIRARDTHGKADLFGFHTGCLVATEMSLRYPAEVHRLVEIDVPYFDAVKRRELLDKDWAVGGFVAAFSYPCEERYAKLEHKTLVVATASDLLEPSRNAAEVIPGSVLKEFPDIEASALENGAAAISKATLEFLDP